MPRRLVAPVLVQHHGGKRCVQHGGLVFPGDARFQAIEDMRAEALPLTFGEHVHARDVVSVSAAHADDLALVQEHVPVAGLDTLLHVLATVQLAEEVDDFGWVVFGIHRADRGLHDVVNPVDMLWTSGNVFHVVPFCLILTERIVFQVGRAAGAKACCEVLKILEGDVAEGKARCCKKGAVRKVHTVELEGCKTPNENGVKYRMKKV